MADSQYKANCLSCGHLIDVRDPGIAVIMQGTVTKHAKYYHADPAGCQEAETRKYSGLGYRETYAALRVESRGKLEKKNLPNLEEIEEAVS